MLTYIHFLLSLYFSATLGIAALSKISNIRYFANNIYSHKIIPSFMVSAFSFIIPVIEMILSLLLIANKWPLPISFVNFLVFCTFLFYKLSAQKKSPNIGCGCYSKPQTQQASIDVTVSIIFVILA